jgi:hypothetical protein
MSEITSTPGFNAMQAALRSLYGDGRPSYYRTVISYRLGGPDPLDCVSAWCASTATPHYHYIGHGLSELYHKESPDLSRSGFGIELTFRLAAPLTAPELPLWPVTFSKTLPAMFFRQGTCSRKATTSTSMDPYYHARRCRLLDGRAVEQAGEGQLGGLVQLLPPLCDLARTAGRGSMAHGWPPWR